MVSVSKGKGNKQDYATPADLIAAVEQRYGKISFDLAASWKNKKHSRYFAAPGTLDLKAEAKDSFAQDWCKLSHTVEPNTLLWLNPEFKRIEPWARKCRDSRDGLVNGVRIAFLVPASVGSDWFKMHVWKQAWTDILNGRPCFDGKDPFPKDCILSIFGPDMEPGIDIWQWK